MIHPKQTLNIGQMNCSLLVPPTVNRNKAYEAMQDECHTGGQEGEIKPSSRHSLPLDDPSPSLTPWSHFPHPKHFLGPVSLLIMSQTFTLLQIPAQFPSLSCSHQLPGEAPTLTRLLCESAHRAFTESWFRITSALVQQILRGLGCQTCPGQTESWGNIASAIQVISSRHVQTAIFGGQIWGRFMKRHMVHSQLRGYPSAQFQVLFPQHAGYRKFKEKGYLYFLTWTKPYFFSGFILENCYIILD